MKVIDSLFASKINLDLNIRSSRLRAKLDIESTQSLKKFLNQQSYQCRK